MAETGPQQGSSLFPRDVATANYEGTFGRMRSRAMGEKRPGMPEVVFVQGMSVADYLMPGLVAFGQWTRAPPRTAGICRERRPTA